MYIDHDLLKVRDDFSCPYHCYPKRFSYETKLTLNKHTNCIYQDYLICSDLCYINN